MPGGVVRSSSGRRAAKGERMTSRSRHVGAGALALAVGCCAQAGRAEGQVQYRTLALEGRQAVGMPAGVVYNRFNFTGSMANLNNTGGAAFQAYVVGPGITAVNDAAIYAGDIDAPQMVAREGNQAHGMPAGVVYEGNSFNGPPTVNDADKVLFGAVLTGP